MKKKFSKILFVNLAVLCALLAQVSIFYFAKHFDDASYVPLLLAALVLVVVDIMRVFVRSRTAAIIWSVIFAILSTSVIEGMMDVGFFLVVASGALVMLLMELPPMMKSNDLIEFIFNMKIWGMLTYAIFTSYGGFWRFFVAIGVGVVASVPSLVLNIACKAKAKRDEEERHIMQVAASQHEAESV